MTSDILSSVSGKLILLVFSIALAGWSWFLKGASDKLDKVYEQQLVTAERVTQNAASIARNVASDREHAARDWHDGAGRAIIRLQEQMPR